MKRIFMVLTAFIISFTAAYAQSPFGYGSNVWNIGLGVADGYLPISVTYEHGIAGGLFDGKGSVGIGGYGSVLVGKDATAFAIAPKAALHYNFTPDLDAYFDLLLGYDSIRDRFAWGSHVGARYFFTPTVGAFAEAGYGFSFLNVGVAFKM